MRVAYLILAHDQPGHLQRLVRTLHADFASFFIHIDAKVALRPFLPTGDIPNVTFLPERIHVNWGGFSMVKAEIRLLQAAYPGQFDYYALLSGRDFPIKGNARIYDFLARSGTTNYMTFYRFAPTDPKRSNLVRYHLPDLVSARRHTEGLTQAVLSRALGVVNAVLPERRFLQGYKLYAGAQWWCLRHEMIGYILDFLTRPESRPFVRYFKLSACADEHFFQNILLNAPFVSQEKCCELDTVEPVHFKKFLHHIDFSPGREKPAILDARDFATLRQSPALFARKFDAQRSATLLDRIERELL